jgi:DNA-binding response OmpR family regulator
MVASEKGLFMRCFLFGTERRASMTATATILVVEDHPTLLENLRLALAAEGHQVLTVSDADEAYAVMQSQSVDLIVIDIVAPENDPELSQRMQEDWEGLAIPSILLRTWGLDGDVLCGDESSVRAYLTRLIEPEALLDAVQDKLRGTRGASANKPESVEVRSSATD